MKQIYFNEANRKYYSEDFIKGFECGTERQYKADQKTGHWINKSHTSGCGVTFVESECTCCGKKTPFNCDEFLYRYCPNCGAKMVEPQESGE